MTFLQDLNKEVKARIDSLKNIFIGIAQFICIIFLLGVFLGASFGLAFWLLMIPAGIIVALELMRHSELLGWATAAVVFLWIFGFI